MSVLLNQLRDCCMFKPVKPCIQRDLGHNLGRVLFSVVVTWMCCNSALALDINQANEAELDSVKGMGPALSAKVLKARAQGPFKNWHDLMHRVSGIRQNKAQQFSQQGLTVDGQVFTAKP
jgi:competence protein ComEA